MSGSVLRSKQENLFQKEGLRMSNTQNDMRARIAAEYDRVLKPVYTEVNVEEVMLPGGDGYRLRTLIYRPCGTTEALSVIVIRSCYPMMEEYVYIQGEELAKRGFGVVIQWCRGLNGSEGTYETYWFEREDGAMLMNWLQDQAWVKNIGLVGASYLALVGWFIADIVPEKVKTMYLTVLGTEWHKEVWQEGAFRQDIFTSWLMSMSGVGEEVDYLQSAAYRPQIQVDEDLWKQRNDVYRDFISHPAPSDAYWTEGAWGTFQKVPGRTKIPVYIGEGWYDIHLQNAIDTFANLSDMAGAHSVLKVNPGNHGLEPMIPNQKKQEHARISDHEQQIRWFKDILMDGVMPDRAIEYYLIGADEWRTYTTYPVPVSEYRSFYLSDGQLLDHLPEEEGRREYDYDPNNPVCSHGSGTLFRTYGGIGSITQPEENFRPDVLSYISDVLSEDLDIVGQIQAVLHVQSDAPDTCFTVKLIEVDEDGTASNIRNGITTLGFRNQAQTWQRYDNEPVEITIRCWDIAFRVKKGSRIRVDISSSNFPEFSVHPNTETPWAFAKEVRTAHQVILTGKDHPSRIVLPIDG